jgi:hypothetical protein
VFCGPLLLSPPLDGSYVHPWQVPWHTLNIDRHAPIVKNVNTPTDSLRKGLTEDNPTLTTYFEGEIIGSRYGFITNHESWGATDKIDISHWNKFTAFRPYSKQARKGNVSIPNLASKDNIFMRWKEHFLVPDHRVRTINGASFEGFYYICFNQKEGAVSGIYFHSKSEK